MLNQLTDAFASAQQWVFETLVVPFAFWAGSGNLLEDGFDATGWMLVGVVQIALIVCVIGPLQRLWPAEPVRDRHAIWVDVLYTLITAWGCSSW